MMSGVRLLRRARVGIVAGLVVGVLMRDVVKVVSDYIDGVGGYGCGVEWNWDMVYC